MNVLRPLFLAVVPLVATTALAQTGAPCAPDLAGRPSCLDENGWRFEARYNREHRLAELRGPKSRARYGYDADGVHVWTEDPLGKVTYAHDDAGNLVHMTIGLAGSNGPVTKTVEYRYDPLDRIAGARILNAFGEQEYAVAIEYDGPQVIQLDLDGFKVEFASNLDGSVMRTIPSGIRTVFPPAGSTDPVTHYRSTWVAAPMTLPSAPGGPEALRPDAVSADGTLQWSGADADWQGQLVLPIGQHRSGLTATFDSAGHLGNVRVQLPAFEAQHRPGTPPTTFLESSLGEPRWAEIPVSVIGDMAAEVDDVGGILFGAAELGGVKGLDSVTKPLDIGIATLRDVAAWQSPTTSLRDKIIKHGLAGKLSETLVAERYGDAVAGPVGGEVIGAAYTLLRNPNVADANVQADLVAHVGDIVFAAPVWVAGTILGGPATGAAAAKLATKIPDLPRQAVAESIKKNAVRGPPHTGRYMYKSALALGHGDLTPVRLHNPDIWSTVRGSPKGRRSAAHRRKDAIYRKFEAALRRGDRRAVADMIRTEPLVQDHLQSANYGVGAQQSLADHLDPPKVSAPDLGGIDLSVPAAARIGALEGARYDSVRQQLILVGDGRRDLPSLPMDLLPVALLAAEAGQPLALSIDPIDPRHPDAGQQVVYIPNEFRFSGAAARTAYEVDVAMKLAFMGARIQHGTFRPIAADGVVRELAELWSDGQYRPMTLEPWVPPLPGFESGGDLAYRLTDGTGGPTRARQWIVIERAEISVDGGDMVRFTDLKMGVRARKQVIGADGKLHDSEEVDEVAKAFARQLTDRWNELSAVDPSFAAMSNVAKVVVLAQWMVDHGVAFDRDWARAAARRRSPHVDRLGTLHWAHRVTEQTWFDDGRRRGIQTAVRTIRVSGGVDLKPQKVVAMVADRETTALAEVADEVRKRAPSAVHRIEHEGRELLASVAPLSPTPPPRLLARDGVIFQLDDSGRPVRGKDNAGNELYLAYEGKRLESLRLLLADGGSAEFREDRWALTSAGGRTVRFRK